MQLPVEVFLKEKEVPYKLVELEGISFTVDDVLRFSSGRLKKEEVCKTIIIKGRKTGTLKGILLRGEDKLDFKKIKALLKEDVAIASSDEVIMVSGVNPGAVCPFLLKCPLFVDDRVLALVTFNCGSGHHLYGLECAIAGLKKSLAYTAVSVIKEAV